MTGTGYADVLADNVIGPLGLKNTSLPVGTGVPDPIWRGYTLDAEGKPHDQSFVRAAGFTGGSGGMVSTPADLDDVIRAMSAAGGRRPRRSPCRSMPTA